ncbi:MAG: YqeG family HAD IIIA-type phosphatase [Clostridia bacterium]|nr:YqeG family HAD IIIA-type phosphatase [Clostridia bacterium]
MRKFKPTLYYKTIEDIDVSVLQEKGIKALILDIDNTLVPPHTPVCDARAKAFVDKMQTKFKICIVSNNIYARAKKFADSFPVDFICDGNKPAKKPFLLALEKLQVKPEEVAVIGDQIFTDVWGANRMHMCAVLVDPVCDKEGKFVKFKRILENIVYKRG